jgi:hypothetical protein
MELIEDDLSLRKMVGCSLQVGWTHVHGDGLDLGGITPMLAQCLSKGAERFGTAPFDHQEQPRAVTIQHVGYVTVSPSGASLIDSDSAHRAPVAPCLSLLNVMDQHPPQTSIGLLQQIGHPIDGHLGA